MSSNVAGQGFGGSGIRACICRSGYRCIGTSREKSGADSRKTLLLPWRAAGMGVLIEGRTVKESNPALSVNCRGDIEGRDGCHPLYIFLFPKKAFLQACKDLLWVSYRKLGF